MILNQTNSTVKSIVEYSALKLELCKKIAEVVNFRSAAYESYLQLYYNSMLDATLRINRIRSEDMNGYHCRENSACGFKDKALTKFLARAYPLISCKSCKIHTSHVLDSTQKLKKGGMYYAL